MSVNGHDSQGGAERRDATSEAMISSAHSLRLPDHWVGILTVRQWRLAVQAIGESRLDELKGMLAEVSEPFRAAFVGHLARIAPDHPAGAAVMLALAHAAHDVRPDQDA
jgi:hypothetical protein